MSLPEFERAVAQPLPATLYPEDLAERRQAVRQAAERAAAGPAALLARTALSS